MGTIRTMRDAISHQFGRRCESQMPNVNREKKNTICYVRMERMARAISLKTNETHPCRVCTVLMRKKDTVLAITVHMHCSVRCTGGLNTSRSVCDEEDATLVHLARTSVHRIFGSVRFSAKIMMNSFSFTRVDINMDPQQQFCLKWNSYSSNLAMTFSNYFKSDLLADVTLYCGGMFEPFFLRIWR